MIGGRIADVVVVVAVVMVVVMGMTVMATCDVSCCQFTDLNHQNLLIQPCL